jgi:probable phosphoglycerate mutase
MGSLVLIRHATTAASSSGRNLGQATDPPLVEDGVALAGDLGRALATELAALSAGELALVTSGALRCRQTAAAATAQLGRPLPAMRDEPALLEIDYGAWDGLTHAESEARDPELRARWEQDPFATRCPGGESGADVAARAFPALESLAGWLAGGRTRAALVVSHHHVIRLWIASVLGIPMPDYRRTVSADPAGYSIVTYGGRAPAIRRLNASPTLPHRTG